MAFGRLQAQEHFSFRTDAPQGFSIESSTPAGLSLHYSIRELGIADIDNGEEKGQEIMLKGCFGSVAEGLPCLPFENRYIAVPRGAKVSVEVKKKGCKTLSNIDLLPVAEARKVKDEGLPELRKDMSVFGKDAPFPTENVAIAQSTQIRGLDVVLLSVTPFRYNPVRKTLEVIYDMDIDIRFEGGDGTFGDVRYLNPAWDNILRDLVINSDMLPEAHYYEQLGEAIRNKEEGCEYLIVIPDDSIFAAWADTLKQFRTRQGILTKVVTTTDCGGNEPENIRDYIVNAYQNWAIPPASVLLFGGNRASIPDVGLKPFIYSIPNSQTVIYHYPCDNAIADMNGDSIPDLAISRFPALTATDCQTYVNKCIQYELNPPTDPNYYDHPLISSGYEEDKWFFINTQSVNGFYRNKLGKHPTNLYMVYSQWDPNPTPPDSIWSSAYNTAAVLDYFGPNGTQYLPESIATFDDWKSMNDKELLKTAFNDGTFLTLYCDHSHQNGWACPVFENRDILTLENQYPTFTINISCLTNNFWDSWSYCFSEVFNKAKVGALGGIGSCSVTFTHYNDLLNWGMFDYIWPDFMPTLGCQTEPDLVHPAYALVAGKIFLSQQTFLPYSLAPNKTEKTMNLFSYLGETYLNLYTETPQRMDIVLSPFQNESVREITFTAEENATVCIAKGDEILHIAKGTGQPMTFALPEMQPSEQYQVTVTKQNRIRYQQDVTIIPATGPYLVMEGYRFHDENGNHLLEYDEAARVDLMLYNAGVGTAENTEIMLLCDSPYVEIAQGSAICTNLLPNHHKTLYNAMHIYIKPDIPDQTILAFKLFLDNGINTQEIEFEQTVAAPTLSIKPNIQLLTGDNQPTLHVSDTITYLTAMVSNTGHAKSQPVDAKMSIKAPFVNVESLNDTLDGLEDGETRAYTFKIRAVATETEEAWLQTHIGFQSGQNHLSLDTILPYGGVYETFETDTLKPLFTWQNDTNYPWDYYSGDAAEGDRCFMTSVPNNKMATLKISMNGHVLPHDATMSLYIKDEGWAELSFIEKLPSGNKTQTYSNTTGWTCINPVFYAGCQMVTIGLRQFSMVSYEYKIDHIYFPPMHHTIAYAGDDMTACNDAAAVELYTAYAYDCHAVLWSTAGDGHFDNDTIINPTYFPGSQDIALGSSYLTLTAYGNDTIESSTRIHFVDGISLGAINGDSVVNKYEQAVSHYSIVSQEGVRYIWQLEPANAGVIYDHGNEIDILWNLHEDDLEATLSATDDNGCSLEPATKHISFIGYSIPEWNAIDFDLYPNPTDGRLNLVMGENLRGKAVVEVYNLLGERLLSQNASHLRQGETVSLDLSKMASGLYIIRLSAENGSCAKKVSVR